jgi:hypothetical protein
VARRADRRTVALGIGAAGAVAAAAIVTLANHSSGPSKQRAAVTAYITRVNDLEQRMQTPLAHVLTAYRDFTHRGSKTRDSAGELGRAEGTLRKLEARIEAIEAPPEAKRLRALLLTLVAAERQVTHEVDELAIFTPRYTRALAAARKAGVELGKALAATNVPQPHALRGTQAQIAAAQRAYAAEAAGAAAHQAGAISAYDGAIRTVTARLRRLTPPPAFAPAFRAQLEAFKVSAGSGDALAAALLKSDRSNVAVVGRRFTSSARIAQSLTAQRAEIGAIKAYNRRARAIGTAASNVRTEVQRLNRTLP